MPKQLNFNVEAPRIKAAVLESLPELVQFASTVADEARRPALWYFRASPELLTKTDGSPVTVADRETEQVIRDLITQRYPEHAIFGEEFGWTSSGQQYTWIIDPIDGTKSYLVGAPTFAMLLALQYEGTPLLGIIDIPALDERWCGAVGQPTTMNGRIVKTSSCTTIKDAVLNIISPDNLKGEDRPTVETVSRLARVRRYSSDGYPHALLASGFVDMIITAGQQPYDYLAMIPVVEGAGGCITDWDGNPLNINSDGHMLVTSTPELHREALNALQAAMGSTP